MPDTKSPTTETNEPEPGKGAKRLLPAAALCIAMLGGGFFIGGKMSAGAEAAPVVDAADEAEAAESEEEAELGHLEGLEAVNVNLEGGHFLRVAVALEIGEHEESGGHGGEETAFPTAPAADLVLTTFSGRSMSELATHEGRESAREELLAAVEEKYGDKVVSLYFTEFVMQ